MTAHLSDGFLHDPDGWITAVVCRCGWRRGPFPDYGTAVDALMEHAAEHAAAESDGIARRLADALRDLFDVHSTSTCDCRTCETTRALLAEYEGRAEK